EWGRPTGAPADAAWPTLSVGLRPVPRPGRWRRPMAFRPGAAHRNAHRPLSDRPSNGQRARGDALHHQADPLRYAKPAIGHLMFRPESAPLGARSEAAGCFLRELHAGGEPELGVDMGEVSCHGARGNEEPAWVISS